MLQAIPEVLIYCDVTTQSSRLVLGRLQFLLYPIAHNPKPKRNRAWQRAPWFWKIILKGLKAQFSALFVASYSLEQVNYPWTAGETLSEVAAQSFLPTCGRRWDGFGLPCVKHLVQVGKIVLSVLLMVLALGTAQKPAWIHMNPTTNVCTEGCVKNTFWANSRDGVGLPCSHAKSKQSPNVRGALLRAQQAAEYLEGWSIFYPNLNEEK